MAKKPFVKKIVLLSVTAVVLALICVLFYNADTDLSLQENLSNFVSGRTAPRPKEFRPDNTGKFMLYTVSTGNSDCHLLIDPGGAAMLVDAADYDDYSAISSVLDKYGVSEIHVLVATHFDLDHIGSMDEIVENFPVKTVYVSGYRDSTGSYINLMRAVESKNITPAVAHAGMRFSLGASSVEVLNPQDHPYEDANSACVVLKVTYGKTGYLLAGDIEEESIRVLVDKYQSKLDCDVLKAAHHGSGSGTTDALLQAATPHFAVIPCGMYNSFGHPHTETLERLAEYNAQVLRTDQMGDVAILSDGSALQAYTQQ